MSNLCVVCHVDAAAGAFNAAKASDALGHHPDNPPDPAVIPGAGGDQTSHFWGGTSSNQGAAGSAPPPTTFYYSRYSISTNRVTCSICHNPHGLVDTQLLRATKDNDLICQQCHIYFYVKNPQAQSTHPIGNYAAAYDAAPIPKKYKLTGDIPNNALQGITLVNGNVSCSSCHAPHFADSDSATADGLLNVTALNFGDGHLLKADGPLRTNKSVLCQTCHTYLEHGKVGNNAAGSGAGDVQIGCLVCHSGHSYDATAPNFFVLRKTVDSLVAGFGSKATLYTTYPTPWATYCISCHGAVTGYTLRVHTLPADNDCKICHAHNAMAYSFAQGSSGTSCSSCHGAPPRIDTVADRVDNTNPDTGYAVGSNGINYRSANQNGKDESTTPHKRHAGALNTDKASVDYAFGSGTVLSACLPCHNDKEDAVSPVSPTHDLADSNLSFQDVYFNSMATYNGVLTAPLYKKTNPNQWMCSGIYCHSNGGKRPITGAAKVLADFKTATTPSWLDGSTTNKIVGDVDECQQCHGEDRASMGSAQKNNSATHDKHLLKLGDGKTKCYLCHSATVDSTGTIPASARDHRFSGTHVNGTPNVVFSSTAFGGDLAAGTYASGATQGTCVVYCHSDAIGGAPAIVPDWDVQGNIVCGSCHSTAAASLSTPHAKHLAIATVTCNDCHFTVSGDATLGTHTGHVDGAYTYNQTSCNNCHGYEVGETTPSWGQPMTNAYCLTCHTGATVGVVKTMTAPTKQHASTRGHNRTTNYPSGNLPGNKVCTDCHLTSITNHVNVTDGDATHLAAAAATCTTSCHGVGGSAVKDGIITHVSKACTACHDPHGDTTQANIYMVRSKSTGNYASDATPVVFTNSGNEVTPLTATNSYDEDDDGLSGATGENNADDLCATCHTFAGGSGHNNRDNTAANHNMGRDCFTSGCHKPHTESTGAFKSGGGNFCNDCHGNPPSLSDDRPPGKIGVHAAHTKVASDDASEDKFDCEVCHPGAASFGLSHGAVPLAAGISNTTCSNACHKSTAGDGSWTDSNGLACTACHYWGSPPNSGDNTISGKTLTGTHNKHFDKLKNCVSCHPNNGSDVMAPHIHIDDHEAWTLNATNDGTVLQDLGAATPDEATVDFTAATTKYGNWNDTANTCGVATANNGLGCHATGSPTWGAAGPLACIACHSNKSTSQVNPTSGLHGVTPLVSGKQHDESFTYNAGANTADCTTCHTATPTVTATDHQDGTLDATRGATGNTKIKFDATIGYSDAVAPTCAPSLTGCHYEQPTKLVDWKRKWHEGATSNTGACAGCHGDWVNGWNTDVQHHTNAKAQSTHGTKGGKTWECMDCHGLESVTLTPYPFTISINDWRQNAGESTTLHGNGVINVNSSGTGFLRVGAISGCPTCHTNWQTDGKHAYTKTEWTLATILADEPTVTCATCHGGLTAASVANYWPDKPGNDGTEDNLGRHLLHMTSLAKAKYNEDITALLTNNVNGDADVKQKYLCAYCHTVPGGDFDHGDTANLPAEVFVSNAVRSSKTLWDVADSDATYASGNCSSVNCHNGKATSSTTNFTWYGTGTQNCTLCHNDIASGPTGTSHQAHIGAGTAIFGKVINCGSCHGGSPTWEGDTTPDTYTVPSSDHISGGFSVSGGSVTVAYDGSYTDAATHTLGTCNKNSCHNNGKDVAPAAYTWGTAITGTCTACHGNTDTGLAEGHDGHLLASSTYGKTISCQDCHEAVSSTDMTGKTNHMSGTVNLTGVTYNGDLAVSGTTWGQCSASSCHRSSPATTVNSPLWNTTAAGCSTCHGSTAATLTSGRHEDHLPNAYIISKCGECHTANANNTSMAGQANHINGSVDIGGSKSLSFSTPGCTSNCHFVDSAARGDWLDANSLTCTDCHSGTFLGKANKDNTSGLHQAINALRHDDSFGAGGNCSSCHSGIVVSTNSPATHMDTTPSVNNTQFGLFGNYNTTNGNCTASCHRDTNTWSRKWIGVTDATVSGGSGQAVCNNCHGQFGAWNAGTVHYRSGSSGASETKGQGHTDADPAKCEDCHGYPSAATHNSNSKIDFSGNGTAYTLTWGTNATPGWFCLQTGCHSAGAAGTEAATTSSSHTYLDSLAFPSPTRATPEKIIYVNGTSTPSAACSGCHINVSGEFWPDGSTYPDRAGAHVEHVAAIATKMGADTLANRNATCGYCHPGGAHSGDQSVSPADVCNTDTDNNNVPDLNTGFKLKKIIGGGDDTGGTYGGFYRSTPGTCSVVACHASSPFTPTWYADTVAPGTIAILTASVPAGSEPGTATLTWTAPGDDGFLDGTAYIYDVRFRLSTDGTISEALWTDVNTKQAGNPPKVDRWGKSQSMIVKGLTPGAAYTFAVKTADERYPAPAAWSAISTQKPSATAQSDNVVPVFTGVSTLKAGDAGDLLIDWEAARDHSHGLTTPILYKVWYGNYSLKAHLANSGTLPAIAKTCYDKDTTPPTVVTCDTSAEDYHIAYATTTALKYQATTGLKYGNAYYAMVRARDPVGNEEANSNEIMALSKASAKLPTTLGNYKANGANSLGAAYSTPQTGVTWAPAAVYKWYRDTAYSTDTNVSGVSFEVYIADSNKNTGLQFSYQLGYGNGTTFTALPGTTGTMTVGKASKRVRKIPLNNFSGMVPSGQKLCVQLTNTGGANMLISYGDTTNKGLLLVNEQQYNHKPTTANATVNTAVSGSPTPGVVNITWTAYTDSDSGQTVHYDLFGSTNSGTNYNYVIATGVCFDGTTYDPDCTPASGDETTTGIQWDTIGDGISGNLVNVVRVRVATGDGYKADNNSLLPHVTADSATFSVNNSTDGWPPALIGSSDNGPGPADDTDDDLKAETRPKQGSVNLTWKAVGNDGYNHGTRAAVYDIRYRLATDGTISDANWSDAATKLAEGEPRPTFSGVMESFELLGLNPETTYTIAMKVGDEAGNYATGISNVVTNAVAGPKCGICHSTPPDETATAGKHANHGFTLNDCSNCHGNDPVLGAQNFKTDHQDGDLKLGFKTANPVVGVLNDVAGTVTYTQGGFVIYQDTDGVGGFNQTSGGTPTDDGTCSGIGSLNVSGCHGPATPDWATATPALTCSACHGLSTRTTDDFYTGREYDANITAGVTQAIKDQIKASPRQDNRGQDTGRYVGAHSKHLNSSFRLAKGDNCRLCHKDNVHYDGDAKVTYDVGAGAGAIWDVDGDGGVNNPNGGGTCSGTSEVNCHGSTTAEWHTSATVACNQCHGFNGVNPSHIKDGGTDRACNYCHPAGHPQGTVQEPAAFMVPNNVTVGINYRSGGIHLLKAIGGRTTLNDATAIDGEAEICWGCHEDQAPVISEWGTNTKANTGSMIYNYGTLSKTKWNTASWQSANTTMFAYKTATIKSTHTANSAGSSTVTGSAFAMSETPDNDDLIRCSYCHDVHNMNKAEGDGVTGTVGAPYLRGTWKGNPYKEDGAPRASSTYSNVVVGTYGFGAIPRGGSGYTANGGYFIDQNSGSPTSGWSLSDSAGLCVLCHTDNVDTMDQKSGENLWLGTNGHSNSAIGGTSNASYKVDIFNYTQRNGATAPLTYTGSGSDAGNPSMGYQNAADYSATVYGEGFRSTEGLGWAKTPTVYDPGRPYSYNAFDWGVTNDNGTIDPLYHNFSCSKCHNPHASRLPKLMITNCLDTQHNKWDDVANLLLPATGTANSGGHDTLSSANGAKRASNWSSAQNCHRYGDPAQTGLGGGWNKVTTWPLAQDTVP